MIDSRAGLEAYLDQCGIAHASVEHEALFTVAESRERRGVLAGAHTKNLFLVDKKKRVFLVVAEESTVVDLKGLHRRIGASGRLSFASPERMRALLGVEPGSVTVFGVVNDTEHAVTVVLDAALTAHDMVNAHPLTNTATTTIATADMLTFLNETGHAPLVLALGPEDDTEGHGRALHE